MSHLHTWTGALSFLAHLAAGLALGTAYFLSVRWTSDRLAAGRGIAGTVAAIVGRFVLLGGVLTLISLEGALPLLVTALGVLVARAVVLRRAGMVRA